MLEKSQVKNALSRYVSPGVARQILSNLNTVELGSKKIEGTVLEIGARIVEYQNPSTPTEMMLYGREVFISLPPDNEFLYGEQVIVYPPTE